MTYVSTAERRRKKDCWAHLDFRTGSRLVTGNVEMLQFDGGQLSEISTSLSDRKRNGRHLFLFFFLFSFDEMGRMVSRGKMLTGRHLKAGLHCGNIVFREKIKPKVSPNVCKIKLDKKSFYFESTLFLYAASHIGNIYAYERGRERRRMRSIDFLSDLKTRTERRRRRKEKGKMSREC